MTDPLLILTGGVEIVQRLPLPISSREGFFIS